MDHSPTPLYYRIANHLRNRIVSGIYPKGELIPTEKQLSEEFDVSRVTIRQALKILEDQGMVIRKQGFGTFVNEHVQLQPIVFSGYIEDIMFQLLSAKVVELTRDEIVPDVEIRQALRLNEGVSSVVTIERTRQVDDDIISFAVNFLPKEVADDISEPELKQYSLIELLDKRENPLGEATQTIMAIAASPTVAVKLQVPAFSPVLLSEIVMYDTTGVPVNLAHVYYRADRYKYTVKMGRLLLKKRL